MHSRILIVLLSMGLGACTLSSGHDFGERAADANLELEVAANSVLLRNVLRAGAGMPMHFSAISGIDSRSRGSVGLGVEAPIRGISRGALLEPLISVEDATPRFSVASTNSASFFRAMLRPVELGVLETLLARRFPQELTMSLVVSEIGWGGLLYRNIPYTAEGEKFRHLLRLLLALGLSSEPLLGDNTLIEDLDQKEALELIQEVGVGNARLQVVPDRQSGKFDVIGEPGGFRLCFRRPPIYELRQLTDAQIARAIGLTCRFWVVSNLGAADLGGRDLKRLTQEQKVHFAFAHEDKLEAGKALFQGIYDVEETELPLAELMEGLVAQSASGEKDGVGEQELGRLEHFGELALTLRSPLEIFEYLGVLIKPSLYGDVRETPVILPDSWYTLDDVCRRNDESPPACSPLILFELLEDSHPLSVAHVEFAGRNWHVASTLESRQDRSSDALAVLSTLVALFTKTEDLGGVSSVTVLP